jgi:hypothetical protein
MKTIKFDVTATKTEGFPKQLKLDSKRKTINIDATARRAEGFTKLPPIELK